MQSQDNNRNEPANEKIEILSQVKARDNFVTEVSNLSRPMIKSIQYGSIRNKNSCPNDHIVEL